MQGPGQGRGQVCGWAQWERGCSASTSLWLQLDFRFLGVSGGWLGIPKSKSTVHGDYRVVSDPPQGAGHSLGGGAGSFRKFPAIAGNCRQLPIGPLFQSWPGVPELGSLVFVATSVEDISPGSASGGSVGASASAGVRLGTPCVAW